MDTVGPSALLLAVLYVLSRWALETVKYAGANPGKGRPDITWRVTWTIALLVSAAGAFSAHVWLINLQRPGWEVFVFNGLIFGGFFVGFATTGHLDHKVRLGIRS